MKLNYYAGVFSLCIVSSFLFLFFILFPLSASSININKDLPISGAQATVTSTSSFNQTKLISKLLNTGNSTPLNFSSAESTTKWAAFIGNVTGEVTIVGTPTGSRIRHFGKVPLSQIKNVIAIVGGPNFDSLTNSSGVHINTVWNFNSTHKDSGNNTFNDGFANISGIGNVPYVNLTGYYQSSGSCNKSNFNFRTGILRKSTVSITAGAYNSLIFASPVYSSRCGFNNKSVNFEMIVPINTSKAKSTQTYSFYLDID